MVKEGLGCPRAVGDDAFTVAGAVLRDMGHRVLERIHHPDGEDIVQILGRPVLLGGGRELHVPQDSGRPGTAAQFHMMLLHAGGNDGQRLFSDIRMDEQGFGRVADRGPGHLGVDGDGRRHRHIRVLVHIYMAVAGAGFDDRHRSILYHRADQARPPPGNEHVEILVHPHHG